MPKFKEGDRALVARAEHASNNGRTVELLSYFEGNDGTPHWKVRDITGESFIGFKGFTLDGVKHADPDQPGFVSDHLGIEEDKLDPVEA